MRAVSKAVVGIFVGGGKQGREGREGVDCGVSEAKLVWFNQRAVSNVSKESEFYSAVYGDMETYLCL